MAAQPWYVRDRARIEGVLAAARYVATVLPSEHVRGDARLRRLVQLTVEEYVRHNPDERALNTDYAHTEALKRRVETYQVLAITRELPGVPAAMRERLALRLRGGPMLRSAEEFQPHLNALYREDMPKAEGVTRTERKRRIRHEREDRESMAREGGEGDDDEAPVAPPPPQPPAKRARERMRKKRVEHPTHMPLRKRDTLLAEWVELKGQYNTALRQFEAKYYDSKHNTMPHVGGGAAPEAQTLFSVLVARMRETGAKLKALYDRTGHPTDDIRQYDQAAPEPGMGALAGYLPWNPPFFNEPWDLLLVTWRHWHQEYHRLVTGASSIPLPPQATEELRLKAVLQMQMTSTILKRLYGPEHGVRIRVYGQSATEESRFPWEFEFPLKR